MSRILNLLKQVKWDILVLPEAEFFVFKSIIRQAQAAESWCKQFLLHTFQKATITFKMFNALSVFIKWYIQRLLLILESKANMHYACTSSLYKQIIWIISEDFYRSFYFEVINDEFACASQMYKNYHSTVLEYLHGSANCRKSQYISKRRTG